MKVLIIEDEIPAANRLRNILTSINKNIEVLDVCTSIQSSVNWLKTNTPPDLILMDIELSDGRSFEIFDKVTISSPVIFTTAYDDFAIKAIKLNALDYLLKPLDKEELVKALDKIYKPTHISKPEYSYINQAFVNTSSGEKPKKLVIYDAMGARFVDIEKIMRLKADSNYTHIHLITGESITSSRTLKAYEEMLSELNFFRVNNTYLINLEYIEKYIKGIGGSIIMTDGATIEVSRLRKKELLELLSLNH